MSTLNNDNDASGNNTRLMSEVLIEKLRDELFENNGGEYSNDAVVNIVTHDSSNPLLVGRIYNSNVSNEHNDDSNNEHNDDSNNNESAHGNEVEDLSDEVKHLINNMNINDEEKQKTHSIAFQLMLDFKYRLPFLRQACIFEAVDRFESEVSEDIDLFYPIVERLGVEILGVSIPKR